MTDWRRSAIRARALVAMAADQGTPHEAAIAEQKLAELIRDLDLELLGTLAEQRQELIRKWEGEQSRIYVTNGRPNAETRDMLATAILFLRHVEAIDVLPSAVALERSRAAVHSEGKT